jgi:hypothetical protein
MMANRPRFILALGVLGMVLLVVAPWAYGRAVEDFQYKLADLKEDPLYLRGMPELTVLVGVVLSALVGAMAVIARAVVRRIGPATPTESADRLPWHWWWLLVAGWGGYLLGAAVVMAGPGRIDYQGSTHLEFGAPLSAGVDVPATCRSVVGRPGEISRVTPMADGLYQIDLRNGATGNVAAWSGAPPGFVSLTDDGAARNDFEIPNVPERPAPYLQLTLADGSTQAEPPIPFVRAYDYRVTRVDERGLTGEADVLGTRFGDPYGSQTLRWVNLEIPDDPWPATIEVTVSWSCDRSNRSTGAH